MADTELAVLKRKVAELEGEVNGEKHVSRHILRKVGSLEDALLELRREAVEHRRETSRMADDLALLRAEFTAFQEKLPGIVTDAMREAFKER